MMNDSKQMQNVMGMLSGKGISAEQMVRSICKERGIDVNEFMNSISDCCCITQRGIDGVNYNGAINTANINANTTAQTQKILDALAQNKIESLQAQVTQLQMQNAMCGVVRYPNATTYCSGANPFGNCGCGNAI